MELTHQQLGPQNQQQPLDKSRLPSQPLLYSPRLTEVTTMLYVDDSSPGIGRLHAQHFKEELTTCGRKAGSLSENTN